VLLALGLANTALSHAAQPLGCLIEPSESVELGSQVIGVLEHVHVDRGSLIQKGQVLATLKADVEKAAARVARSRAQAQADVDSALVNRDYNRQRLIRSEQLVTRNFISPQALDQTRAEADVAEQRLAQAREQKRIWDHEYEMARAQLALRSLVSPLSGVVVDRYLSPGARVEVGPVLKVATMNPLSVEVFMPAASYGQIKPGMSATVYPELPNAGERAATVTLVDQFIDPASNTFRVRLTLPNPNHELPAGLRCKVAIGEQTIVQPSGPSRDAGRSAPAPGSSTAANPSALRAPAIVAPTSALPPAVPSATTVHPPAAAPSPPGTAAPARPPPAPSTVAPAKLAPQSASEVRPAVPAHSQSALATPIAPAARIDRSTMLPAPPPLVLDAGRWLLEKTGAGR
jgi:RND family efflux transporter MFP subunit